MAIGMKVKLRGNCGSGSSLGLPSTRPGRVSKMGWEGLSDQKKQQLCFVCFAKSEKWWKILTCFCRLEINIFSSHYAHERVWNEVEIMSILDINWKHDKNHQFGHTVEATGLIGFNLWLNAKYVQWMQRRIRHDVTIFDGIWVVMAWMDRINKRN